MMMQRVFENPDVASAILEFCIFDDVQSLYHSFQVNSALRSLLPYTFHRLSKVFIRINTSRRTFNRQVAWGSKQIAHLPEIHFIAPSPTSSSSCLSTSAAYMNLSDRNFCNVISSFEFLRVISMPDESNGKDITKSFRCLNKLLGTLTDLNLKLLSNLLDADLQHYCDKGSNKLKLLNLTNAYKITDVGIACIAKASKNLQFLDISECTHLTDRGIRSLTENCYGLRELSLSGLVEVTDQSLVMLSQSCKYLSMLNLCDVGNITDEGIDTLAKGCPLLSQLDLSLCVNITNASLTSLSMHSKLLSKLSLFWCDLITDNGIKTLCAKNPNNLKDIDISRCSSLTDKAVAHIVRRCLHLTNLDVCENHWLTDRSLFVILKYALYKIRNLNVSACDNISTAGLHKFLKRQHFRNGALTALDCSFCNCTRRLDPVMVRIFQDATRVRGKNKSIIILE